MTDNKLTPPDRSPEVDAFLQKTPGLLNKFKDGVLRELSASERPVSGLPATAQMGSPAVTAGETAPPYLIAALKAADAAINPPDLGGISLADWNVRLKDATAIIRAALQAAGEA